MTILPQARMLLARPLWQLLQLQVIPFKTFKTTQVKKVAYTPQISVFSTLLFTAQEQISQYFPLAKVVHCSKECF